MTEGIWARDEVLVSLFDQAGLAGEQFRKLQARLRALKNATGGSLTTIVVTSPLMGEGKTACAANLAVALSGEPDRRVLLLDCDVRKPRVHAFLEQAPRRGLLDLLEGRCKFSEAVMTMPGGTLDVVTLPAPSAGNGARPHSLPIEQLKVLLGSLKKNYEFIICDSPPLLPTADAGALADICDGTIMVIRAGATPRPAAARALASINKQKLIGFLLNGVLESRMGSYYYKYYGEDERSRGKKR
ncbi:MAG TPA: AAA family ATPase [Candidatus Polarisedimenticolia bacterium]|nr:AAA family ATPase [Candidatus Polarisedimenticolia bacterium]